MKHDMLDKIKSGYAVYDFADDSRRYFICKWYLYPIFRTGALIIDAKYGIYRWLNLKGIMHTEIGKIMHWSDIKKVKK